MQREIKFRGKRLDNGDWAVGLLDYNPDLKKQFQWSIVWYTEDDDGNNTRHIAKVDPATVGQYFKTDTNGNEIYDGDKVVMHQFLFDGNEYDNEVTGVIRWGEYGWMLTEIRNKGVNAHMGYEDGKGETYLMDFYGLHEESFTKHDTPNPLEATSNE